MLKECSKELASIIINFFQVRLDNGASYQDWRNANFTPIFKKGDRHTAPNYHPVSLNCFCCKMLEHIICRHIMNHLEHHKSTGHSCEYKLIITLDDLMKQFDLKHKMTWQLFLYSNYSPVEYIVFVLRWSLLRPLRSL